MSTAQIARTGIIPQTKTSVGKCKRKCPGGYKCVCDALPHEIHVCQHPDCWCHSQQRYEVGERVYEEVAAWKR